MPFDPRFSYDDDEGDFNNRLESIMGELRSRGYTVKPRKRRTADEQREIYKFGRSSEKPGPIRTEMSGEPGRESLHQTGTAADLDFFDREGRLVKSGDYPGFKEAGELGEKWGLEWGGRWKKERPDDVGPDPAHLQLADLRRLRKNKEPETGNLGSASATARSEETYKRGNHEPLTATRYVREAGDWLSEKAGDAKDWASEKIGDTLRSGHEGPVPMSFKDAATPKRRRTQDIELPDENVRTFWQGTKGILGGRLTDINLEPEKKPEEYVEDRPPTRGGRQTNIQLQPPNEPEPSQFNLDPRYSDALPQTRRLGTLPRSTDTSDEKFNMDIGARDDFPQASRTPLGPEEAPTPRRPASQQAESYKIRDKRSGKTYTWWDFRPPTPQQARQYIWEQENQSLWEKFNAPLSRMPSRAARKIVAGGEQEPSPFGIKQKLADLVQSNPDDSPTQAYWRGMGQGTVTGIGDIASEMTNLPNLIGTAASAGTYGTARAGLTGAAKGFSAIEKAIAGGMMAHGGARAGTGLYEGDMSEFGAGALETAMGGLGWAGSRIPKFGADAAPPPPTVNLGRGYDPNAMVPYRAPRGGGPGGIGDIVEGEVIRGGLPPYEGPPRLPASRFQPEPPPPPSGPFYTGKYGAVGTDINKVETTFQPPDLPPPDVPAPPPPRRGGALRNPTTGMERASDADLEFAARTGDRAAALEIRNRAKAAKAAQSEITQRGLEEEYQPTLEETPTIKPLADKLRASLGKEKPPTKKAKPISDDDLMFMAEQGDKAALAEARKRGLIRGQGGKTARAPGDLGKLRSLVKGRFVDRDELFNPKSLESLAYEDWDLARSEGLLEARAAVGRGLDWQNQVIGREVAGRQGLYNETRGIPVRDSIIMRRALEDRLEKLPPDNAFPPDSPRGRQLVKTKKALIDRIERLSQAEVDAKGPYNPVRAKEQLARQKWNELPPEGGKIEAILEGPKGKTYDTYEDFQADQNKSQWTGGDPDAALARTVELEDLRGDKSRKASFGNTETVRQLKQNLKEYVSEIKRLRKKGVSEKQIFRLEMEQKRLESRIESMADKVGKPVKGDNKTVALFRRELPQTNKMEDMRFILPDGTRLTHYSDIHAEAAESIGTTLDDALMDGVVRWSGYGAETGAPITEQQAQMIADAAFFSRSDTIWMDVDMTKLGGRRASRAFKKDASADQIRTWVNSHFKGNKIPKTNKEVLIAKGVDESMLAKYSDEEAGEILYNFERGVEPAFFEPRPKDVESASPEIAKNLEMQYKVKDAGGIGVLSDDVRKAMDHDGLNFDDAVKKVSSGFGSDFADFLADVLTRRWGGGGERGATNLDFLTGGLFGGKGKGGTVRGAKDKKPGRFSRLVQPAKGTRYEADFADWVNKKKAATVEGILKGREFGELKDLGIDGIKAFVNGSRTGKLGKVGDYLYGKLRQMNEAGVKTNREMHRLTDIWDGTEEEIKAAYEKMGKKQSYSFDTILKDLKTGMNGGLKPKFEDMSQFIQWYETKVNRTVTNKQYVKKFIEKGWLKPEGQSEPGWKSVDQYIRAGQKRLTASPEFHGLIRSHLGDESKINKWMGDFSSLGKNFSMSAGVPLPKPGGSFHGVLEPTAVNSHGLNILARTVIGNPKQALKTGKYLINPKSAKADLDSMLHRAPEAVQRGLTLTTEGYEFGKSGGSSELVNQLVGEKAGKWLTKGLEQTGKLFEDPLFQQVIPATKLKHWIDLEADFMKGGMSKESAGKAAADFSNELYGGINWEALGRSKDLQNLGRAFILAPDWAETNARLGKHVPSSFFQKGGPLNKKYKAAAYSLVAAYVGANVVNYALSGHLMVQNSPGHTLDIDLGTGPGDKKAWFRPFGTAADFARLPFDIVAGAAGEMIPGRMEPSDLSQLSQMTKNRASIPFGATINLLSRRDRFGRPVGAKDDYGRPISPGKQAWAMTEEGLSAVAPPYLKAGADYMLGDISGPEALAGGFEVPFKFSSAPRESGSRNRSQRSRRESR